MPIVTLADLKSKKSAKPITFNKGSTKLPRKAACAKGVTTPSNIRTLADFNKSTKRSAASAEHDYNDENDESYDREYAPLSEDEDSDVMSADEAEMAADIQELVDLDGSFIHVLNSEIVDNGQLFNDIRSSDKYQKMTGLKKLRTKEALGSTEEAQGVENGPDVTETSLPIMVTDVNNQAAGPFKYDPSHTDSNGWAEWDIVRLKIKVKRDVRVDGKKKVVAETKTAAKVFEDGSIAVHKWGFKGIGTRRNKRMRTSK
ncbi:Nn.00g023210.m01.CDS01 [Neocucurbitaria sp. VM-36]